MRDRTPAPTSQAMFRSTLEKFRADYITSRVWNAKNQFIMEVVRCQSKVKRKPCPRKDQGQGRVTLFQGSDLGDTTNRF